MQQFQVPDPKLNSCVTSHYIYLFVFLYKQTSARRYEEIPFKLCGLRLCHVLLLALLTGSRMGMLQNGHAEVGPDSARFAHVVGVFGTCVPALCEHVSWNVCF